MDEPDHTDVDLPEVDGIPILPYGMQSQPTMLCSDKDMEHGLILAIALPFVCAILFALFVIAGRLGLW